MKKNGVVFTGFAGSGKSTAAQITTKLLNNLEGKVVVNLAFAGTLKAMLAEVPLINNYELLTNSKVKGEVLPEIGVTPRHMMQTLGTQWGRELIHPDFWIKCIEHKWNALVQSHEENDTGTDLLLVIDDCRFSNELTWATKSANLHHVHVVNKRYNAPQALDHESEKQAATMGAVSDVILDNWYNGLIPLEERIEQDINFDLF